MTPQLVTPSMPRRFARPTWLAAIAAATLAAISLVPTPAHAAYGVIEDEGLAACLNRSFTPARDDAQAITAADLLAIPRQLTCGEGPSIRTFAGFEGASNLLSITIVGKMHELSAPDAMTPLSSIPKLSTVSLSDVNVSNDGFSGLAGAANLHTVKITNAPELSDLAPLAGKAAITTLELINLPALTDLTPLSDVVRLKTLNLGYNSALADLSGLEELLALDRLTIQGTAVADLTPIAGLTNLSSLAATGAKITTLAPLSGLLNLQSLWVADNALTSLEGLENLTELTNVWASGNTLTGGIAALAGKPKLLRLQLRGTGITSLESLADSTELQHLDAVGNHIPSLVGLRDWSDSTSLTVSSQVVRGPAQYVPRNATTFRVDADGQVALRDGLTFPPLYETSSPPSGPVADPELPMLLFNKPNQATGLSYWVKDGDGFNQFSANVVMAFEWSDITSDAEISVLTGSVVSHQTTVSQGFPVKTFALGENAPEWLTIDGASGLLTGTPPTAGAFTFTLLAADALGNTIAQEVTITAAALGSSVIEIGADQKDNAGTPLTFTVSRTNATENPWTGEAAVDVTTVDGSAVAGTDYTAVTERLVWAADDTAPKTVTVTTAPAAEGAPAAEKTFQVELSAPAASTTLGERTTATGTIVTQETTPPEPEFEQSVIEIGADQKDNAGTPLTFTVSRTNATENPWTGEAAVDVTTVDGSAVAGTDYTAVTERLVWAADDTAPKTIAVATLAPKTQQAGTEKSFTVTLSAPAEHTHLGERAKATGTIVTKDDGAVTPPSPNPDPDPKPTPGPGTKPDPGKGGGLVATGAQGAVLSWIVGGTALLAGAAVLFIRRIRRSPSE